MENLLRTAQTYYDQNIDSILKAYTSNCEIIVVIGGSYSYGFNDAYSDVDVFIIINMDENIWFNEVFKKMQPFMFNHKELDGYRIQFIPLLLTYKGNSDLKNILNGGSINEIDNALLYNISKYQPVYKSEKLEQVKLKIITLNNDFWNKRCRQYSLHHVDILEQFHGSLKRNDMQSLMLSISPVISGFLELVYLSQDNFYPPNKWLWKGLKINQPEIFDDLNGLLPFSIFYNVESLKAGILNFTNYVCKLLKGKVDEHVLEALKNP